MSTEHTGGYCEHNGKMRLSLSKVQQYAGQMHATYYKCPKCGDYHLTSVGKENRNRLRGKEGKKSRRPRGGPRPY